MLEDQMSDDSGTEPAPEPSSPTDQIQELVELQAQMEQLQSAGGEGEAEVAEQVSAVIEQMDERMRRLEQQIAEQGSEQPPQQPQQESALGSDSMLGEIAMLADQVEDPDLLSMLIETQTDPEVLEARAKSKEVENETEWKKAIAESLSPQATEKAVDLLGNLTSGLSAPAAQQPPQRPQQQAQQPQQPQRQPQQQPQRQAQDVAIVEDDQPQASAPEPEPETDEAEEVSSPLREEGEREIEFQDGPESGTGPEDGGPEAEAVEEGNSPEGEE